MPWYTYYHGLSLYRQIVSLPNVFSVVRGVVVPVVSWSGHKHKDGDGKVTRLLPKRCGVYPVLLPFLLWDASIGARIPRLVRSIACIFRIKVWDGCYHRSVAPSGSVVVLSDVLPDQDLYVANCKTHRRVPVLGAVDFVSGCSKCSYKRPKRGSKPVVYRKWLTSCFSSAPSMLKSCRVPRKIVIHRCQPPR